MTPRIAHFSIWPLLVLTLLSGCELLPGRPPETTVLQFQFDAQAPLERLTAHGRGAVVQDATLTPQQQKLLARRAAVLDAYRTLAENLYGVQIDGETTLRNIAVLNDRLRTRIDHELQGARLIGFSEPEQQIVEATLELSVRPELMHCIDLIRQGLPEINCNEISRQGQITLPASGTGSSHFTQEPSSTLVPRGPRPPMTQTRLYYVD